MPKKSIPPGEYDEVVEHLRDGTRQQYESGWTLIRTTALKSFQHNLGDIPWLVSVIKSLQSDGSLPTEANSDVTVAYTDIDGSSGSGETTITVTNDLAEDYYFNVRAL